MDDYSRFQALRRGVILLTRIAAVTLCCGILSACVRAEPRRTHDSALRDGYTVTISTTRLKDRSPLSSTAVLVVLGEKKTVRIRSKIATEDTPALPEFTVILSPTKTAGLFQLETRVAIVEASRDKKGRLKVNKRNQGALLPLHLGETQVASVANDPIQIEVRVDRP